MMEACFYSAGTDATDKSADVLLVGKGKGDNPANAKGIASHLCPDVENGGDLLKRMTEYADAGINILRVEYGNNGTLRLDSYIE